MENKIFAAHPHLERYFETSDGEAFYTDTDARFHAKSLSDKNVKTVENSGNVNNIEVTEENVAPAKGPTANEVIEQIKAATTLDELNAFSGDTRSTVKKAFDTKKQKIEESIAASGSGDGENGAGSEGADPDNGESNKE